MMKAQLVQRLIPKRPTWSRRFVSVTQSTSSAPQSTRMLLLKNRPYNLNFQQQKQQQQQQLRGMVIVSQHKANDAATSSSAVKVTVTESGSATPQSNSQDAALIITDSCWNRIRELMIKKQQQSSQCEEQPDLYLRVFVDAGGCSGFSYNFEMDTAKNLEEDDVIFSQENVNQDAASDADPFRPRVVVDPESLELMKGATLDYVTELIKSSFEIRDNPLSESACGCGSSFALKNFAANPAVD